MRRRKRFGATLVTASFAAGAGVALAGAFNPAPGDTVIGETGGLKYEKDPAQFDMPVPFHGQSAIACGRRWHATGGGGRLKGPVSEVRLQETQPRDVAAGLPSGDGNDEPDDAWSVAGRGHEDKLIAYGICSREGDLRYRTKAAPDDSIPSRSAKVGCGGPKWHVLGGGAIIAPNNSWIASSHPFDGNDPGKKPDDGWAVKANDTAMGMGALVVSAICRRGKAPDYERRKVEFEAGESAGPVARCEGGSHVTGGGVRVSGPANRIRVVRTYPIDGGDSGKLPDDGWKGVAYNDSGVPPKTVVSYAICRG